MHAYSPGKPIDEVKRELGLTRVVKLASNENPLGPSPMAVEAARRAAEQMHLYPDAAAFELKSALAGHFNVPTERVIVGNGSDELLHLLGQILLSGPDDEVVIGKPSFVRYNAAANLADAKLIQVSLDSDLKHDLPAMADVVTERTKLVFIANPHNPTGTIVRKAELDAFLTRLPETALVVLDEAYFEFADGVKDFPNSIDYLKAGRNVVGLRTFSKAYGLAGIRLGYGFAPPEIADAIARIREPFGVNLVAQASGIAALEDQAHVRQTVENNRHGVEKLAQAFTRVGAKPFESYANFVFADLGRPAAQVFQALLRQGVITRSGEVFGLPNFLRVSIGTEEEMNVFVEAFESCMKEAVAP